MAIKKFEQVKLSPQVRKDAPTSVDTSERIKNIEDMVDFTDTVENFTEELKSSSTTKKITMPKSDQERFNINKEDIISEIDYGTTHIYILKDGRRLIYKKDENNNLILYQIYKINALGKTESIKFYDTEGNEKMTIEYEYDKNGKLISTKKTDNFKKTTVVTKYESNQITETTTDADGKVLRVTTKKLNVRGLVEGETVEDFYYNEKGEKIMSTSIDTKTGKESTSFYNEQGEVLMTFPYNLIGEDSAIKETGYDGFYDYSDRTRLGKKITEVLTPKEIEEINNRINQNVDSAGRGTGAGVAAALTTLITELQNKGIMLPYFLGGEHMDVTAGINPEWGEEATIPNASGRKRISADCTGIIAWAMETAGINCPPTDLGINQEAENNGEIVKTEEDLKENPIKPGTILACPDHDILVVNTYTDAEGQEHLVCAQSKGGGINGETGAKANDDGDSYGGIVLTDYTYTIDGTITDSKGNTGIGIKIDTAYYHICERGGCMLWQQIQLNH